MSSSSDNLNPREQPAPRWYCRRSNQTIGPLSTDEMVALIDRRTLADYDVVRLDGTNEWQKVGEIRKALTEPAAEPSQQAATSACSSESVSSPEELSVTIDPETSPCTPSREESASSSESSALPPPQTSDGGHEAADAASEALAHMNVARLRRHESGKGRRRNRSRIGKAVATTVIEVSSAVSTWLLLRIGQALKHRSVQAVLAVMLVAAIIWGVVLPRWPVDNRLLYTRFAELSQQIRTYHGESATPQQWQQLEDEVADTVDGSRVRLEREANSQRPDLQELLAAAELLPAAVRDGQSADNEKQVAASKLAIHLDNAERLIARRAELSAQMPQGEDSFAAGDAMFWAMVAIDFVLALAVLIWIIRVVIRRWGSRQTPTAT